MQLPGTMQLMQPMLRPGTVTIGPHGALIGGNMLRPGQLPGMPAGECCMKIYICRLCATVIHISLSRSTAHAGNRAARTASWSDAYAWHECHAAGTSQHAADVAAALQMMFARRCAGTVTGAAAAGCVCRASAAAFCRHAAS